MTGPQAEQFVEIRAACTRCSMVMQAIWNHVGEPCCPTCQQPMGYSVVGPAERPLNNVGIDSEGSQ